MGFSKEIYLLKGPKGPKPPGAGADSDPLRESTGAPDVSLAGVELQPAIRADTSAGMRSFFMGFSVEAY
jgi:hypothetical protein